MIHLSSKSSMLQKLVASKSFMLVSHSCMDVAEQCVLLIYSGSAAGHKWTFYFICFILWVWEGRGLEAAVTAF